MDEKRICHECGAAPVLYQADGKLFCKAHKHIAAELSAKESLRKWSARAVRDAEFVRRAATA